MKKIETGIKGLDEVLRGGIPAKRNILVCGGPGCGKSLLCFEYIYRGAKKGEPGLYISLQETPETMLDNVVEAFPNWSDLPSLLKNKKIFIEKPDKMDLLSVADMIEKYVSDYGVKRAVIDSVTLLSYDFDNDYKYRQTVQEFLILLSNLDCTVLLTYDLPSINRVNLNFAIEQFITDGVILLYNLEKAEKRIRTIEVVKMRGTNYLEEMVPFRFTPDGIAVYVGEKVF